MHCLHAPYLFFIRLKGIEKSKSKRHGGLLSFLLSDSVQAGSLNKIIGFHNNLMSYNLDIALVYTDIFNGL